MEKLEIIEKIKLKAYKEKVSNLIIMWGGGVFILLLIISSIPTGLLPKKRNITISNPDLNMFESIGILPTLIILIIISGLTSFYVYNNFKYSKLSKDVIEQKKIILKVIVENVIYKEGPGPKEIDLFFSPPYNSTNKIEFVGEDNFPKLYKNQEIELTLTKNALFPLGIKPKNDLNDLNDFLEMLNG